MIEISGLKKEYMGRCVLEIKSLRFELGKRYALLGANGSGKSTLLRIIAGVVEASAGTVMTNITGKREMGYLPQAPYGFSFSVLQNVLIAMEKNKSNIERAKEAIEAVGMSALIDVGASKLSGGETQRMAFARMIAMPRKLLLLDEPTAATDLRGIDLIEAALLRYCSDNLCTVVFATHSPAQALRLADEIVFLEQGAVAEQGETRQIINEPQSRAVQDFLKHWKLKA